MTDHDHEDDLQDKLDQLAAIPRDVVPRAEAEAEPARFTVGDHVTVTWPGDVTEDADGSIVGVDASRTYEMTATSESTLAGWSHGDDEEGEQS